MARGDSTGMPEGLSVARQAVEAAAVYAGALFPATVAGMVSWTLSSYLEQGRLHEARTIAVDVVTHAEAAGWSIRTDAQGFLEAVAPPGPDTLTVYRGGPGQQWQLLDTLGDRHGLSDKAATVLSWAASEAIRRPGVVIKWRDLGQP
jgi:hypothetical protein